LKNTILEKANLINVNLKDINLEGAKLDKAIYNQRTIDTVNNPEYKTLFDRAYKIEAKSALDKSDLADQFLNGLDLTGARLREADLQRTYLKSTKLNNACLYKANLKNADLKDADLSGANLKDADLSGANLINANLDGVKQFDTVIHDKNTKYNLKYKSIFSHKSSDSPAINTTCIEKTDESYQKIKKLNQPVDYSQVDVDLSKVNFSDYEFAKKSSFNGTILKNANFSGAILEYVDFTDADLTDADFSGANLKRVMGLTVEQLQTVKSLAGTQFSPELCQVVKEELKDKKGKIADCPK
jgi:uncharacterized protein YjbI with pentapeptide repeats